MTKKMGAMCLRFLAILVLPNAATGGALDGCGLELTSCRDSLALEAEAAVELRGNLSKLSAGNTALMEMVTELRRRVADLEAQSSKRRHLPAATAVLPSAILSPYGRRSMVSSNTTYSVGCFRSGSSFDNPACDCLGSPKPSQFGFRPTIRIIAGSW